MTSSQTLLIEPNRLFRQGLKHLLAGTRFEVGAEFNTVALALEAGETAGTPDLVISGQPVTDEADARAIREAFPSARIVVLADDLSVDVLRAAMGGGADGFLSKSVAPEALIQSLQLVMLGEKVFPTNLAAMLLDLKQRAVSAELDPRPVPARERNSPGAGDRRQQQGDRLQARHHGSDRQGSPQDAAAQDRRQQPHPGRHLGDEQRLHRRQRTRTDPWPSCSCRLSARIMDAIVSRLGRHLRKDRAS